MTDETRVPVLIGAGQSIERDATVSALDLAERAAGAALDDAGGIEGAIDRVSVVNMLSRVGPAPATDLAARLGIAGATCEATVVGGNTPQALVNRAAVDISAGRISGTLIAGAEAMRSARTGEKVPSGGKADEADPVLGQDRLGVGESEMSVGLLVPAHIYAMVDSAVAHREGRTGAEHRKALGDLMAPFTEVAAKHPWAWFPEPLNAASIAEVTEANRVVAEPYTKKMCAFLNVDQGAAVIVSSLAAARAAGLADQAVFVAAGADAVDVWEPTARPDIAASPAIAAAAGGVMDAAGLAIDEIELLDLYSCFPAAVQLAAEAIGIHPATTDRQLTLTGGLPYFGGPGNNYSTHAIATAAGLLREGASNALIGALGWYVTKHSYGLYTSAPPASGYAAVDLAGEQKAIDESARTIVGPGEDIDTPGIVVAATQGTDRDGNTPSAPVIADLPDGRRAVAAAADPASAPVDIVGRAVHLRGQTWSEVNR